MHIATTVGRVCDDNGTMFSNLRKYVPSSHHNLPVVSQTKQDDQVQLRVSLVLPSPPPATAALGMRA